MDKEGEIARAFKNLEDRVGALESKLREGGGRDVSLRDRFAMAALTGMLAKVSYVVDENIEPKMREEMVTTDISRKSYAIADAMMKAREVNDE